MAKVAISAVRSTAAKTHHTLRSYREHARSSVEEDSKIDDEIETTVLEDTMKPGTDAVVVPVDATSKSPSPGPTSRPDASNRYGVLPPLQKD